MKTCVVIFSHANTPEKKIKLRESIKSIKDLNLPILLSSNVVVDLEIINEVNHFIYNKENLIFKETDFFDLDLPVSEMNYNFQFFFGGISTRTFIRKKIYSPAILNHFIASVNQCKLLGYDYVLITEYDYVFDEKSKKFITDAYKKIELENLDGFYVPCSMSGIKTVFPIPLIFKIDKFLQYCGSSIVKTPLDFVRVNQFKIDEQWTYDFCRFLEKPITIPYESWSEIFGSTFSNQIEASSFDVGFNKINSGLFINKHDKSEWIYSVYNDSGKDVKISTKLFLSGNLFFEHTKLFGNGHWYFIKIDKNQINEIFESNKEILVSEIWNDGDNDNIFEYKISSKNIENIKKLKFFFKLDE